MTFGEQVGKKIDALTSNQKYYRKHREDEIRKSKEYYQKNKEKIKAWKLEYRAKNRKFLLNQRKIKRDRLMSSWRENAVTNSAKQAEDIILEKVLPNLGFEDIFRPTRNFYFDSLAIKSEKIHAIEVATTQEKQLSRYRIDFCKYFKLDILVFIVKPDLSCYYLIELKYPNYRSNPWWKQGNKVELKNPPVTT